MFSGTSAALYEQPSGPPAHSPAGPSSAAAWPGSAGRAARGAAWGETAPNTVRWYV